MILRAAGPELDAWLSRRGPLLDEETRAKAAAILADVRERGDEALLESGRRFDAPGLASVHLTPEEWEVRLDAEDEAALEIAIERVQRFHAEQYRRLTEGWQATPYGHRWSAHGVGQIVRPLSRVGVYVPGGNAVYPSSVIMNVIPAIAAGVEEIVVATPARQDGTLSAAVLWVLRRLGVAEVLKVGGAAAIAALAYGTQTLRPVEKVCGPGNRWVNAAKALLWGSVGVDGYAGPSEVCVLTDRSSNLVFAAADFLTQIEHAEDNFGVAVCLDGTAGALGEEIRTQAARVPASAPMHRALEGSVLIEAESLDQAIGIVNAIAPEHLSLAIADPGAVLPRIRNAGCVLLGEWSPESAGDYLAGPSHTLPTARAARFGSPVNVLDFLKVQSTVELSESQIQDLEPTIGRLARLEGFPVHASGARVRVSRETAQDG